MSVVKLNVLHWHLYDYESFPLEIRSYPFLWNSSFSPAERYTRSDVRHLVAYGKAHGVRVVVELDMPGHASSWCRGYPDVCPSHACDQPLNVANPRTFTMVRDVVAEIAGRGTSDAVYSDATGESDKEPPLFDDDFIHFGGDEIELDCWKVAPTIMAWLKHHDMTPIDGVTLFISRVVRIAEMNERTPIFWEEVFHNHRAALGNDSVVQVWRTRDTVREVVQAGLRAIVSNSLSSMSLPGRGGGRQFEGVGYIHLTHAAIRSITLRVYSMAWMPFQAELQCEQQFLDVILRF
eukprot:m.506825 g.506825  ORF g.506825 m.506825 type:complete len:292 (-) comp21877_c0_seq14:239-1114(-)